MRQATFINWTDKDFTAYWDGKPYTFKPGQKREHMKELIARHFAKHLTNQVLQDKSNKIKDGEKFTSPKKPQEVDKFMTLFNKAFKLEGGEDVNEETGIPVDSSPNEPSMNVETQTKQTIDPYDANASPQTGPSGKPQVVETEEEAEEDKFEGNDEK